MAAADGGRLHRVAVRRCQGRPPADLRPGPLGSRQQGDVGIEERSGYTPFVPNRQLAAVKAATRTRVDLGLRFTAAPASARLSSASPIGQCTHKVGLTCADEVDGEVASLLRLAWEQN